MIDLLHPPLPKDPTAEYQRHLQRARLHNLSTSRSHQDFFADNYVVVKLDVQESKEKKAQLPVD